MKGGIHFTEPLSSNIYIQTHNCWEAFMKYAVEMGSGALIYTPRVI
jgi:hypothetical protein